MIRNSNFEKGSAHLIIVIVLTLALIGALGFIFWQNVLSKDTNPAETNASTSADGSDASTDETDETAQWLSYTHATGNFSVRIPDGWKLVSISGDNQWKDNLAGFNEDNVSFTAGTKASLTDVEEPAWDITKFNLTFSSNENGTPAELNLVDSYKNAHGLSVYKYETVATETSIAGSAGTKFYTWVVRDDKTFLGKIFFNTSYFPGNNEESASLDISPEIELMIETVQFL